MQAPVRTSTLATAAVLALAMALTVSAAMLAGGNAGPACSSSCRVALVADRTLEFAPARTDARLPVSGPCRVSSALDADLAPAHAAPAAWRSLDMPPPAR
jgi:hypothetical protein